MNRKRCAQAGWRGLQEKGNRKSVFHPPPNRRKASGPIDEKARDSRRSRVDGLCHQDGGCVSKAMGSGHSATTRVPSFLRDSVVNPPPPVFPTADHAPQPHAFGGSDVQSATRNRQHGKQEGMMWMGRTPVPCPFPERAGAAPLISSGACS